MTDTDRVTRRSVLKATGAAAATAAVGTAPAAAIMPGECAVLARTTDLYIEACPPTGLFTTADPGPTGTVLEVCRDGVTEWAKIDWDGLPISWVDMDDLGPCQP